MSKFSDIVQVVKSTIQQHTPEILTGIGIAGMIATTVVAVEATPKAMRILEERKKQEKEKDENFEKLPVKEVIKETWKCYVPAVAIGGASVACLISSTIVGGKRAAVLATAYKMAESTHSQYRQKVIDTIGEKKEKQIQDSIAQDNVNNSPVQAGAVIVTGRGETLCYDTFSDRYFQSDMNTIEKAINKLNFQMSTGEPYVSLNQFYSEIGLNSMKLGDDLGWNIRNGLMEIRFSSVISSDGRPALSINYDVEPEKNYYKIY